MLVLFTDFGWQGPYVGLLKKVLIQHAPTLPVIDLMHDAPAFDPQVAAYLLATYASEFPEDTVFVGVIDPGVGGSRAGMILRTDCHWFVGPDNGLFDRVAARSRKSAAWRITWQPPHLSASFHGRDLFAPVAAKLAAGMAIPEELGEPMEPTCRNWPDDLSRIIYIDRYGNAMTGVRAASLGADTAIRIRDQRIPRGRTFSDLPPGQGFWYENSSGLVEIAVNQGSAVAQFGLRLGDPIQVIGEILSRIREH